MKLLDIAFTMLLRHCILLKRGSQASDPARVAFEGAAEDELFGHDCGVRGLSFDQLVQEYQSDLITW